MLAWSLLSEELQRIIVETISLPKLVECAIVEGKGGVHEVGAENDKATAMNSELLVECRKMLGGRAEMAK